MKVYRTFIRGSSKFVAPLHVLASTVPGHFLSGLMRSIGPLRNWKNCSPLLPSSGYLIHTGSRS